MLVGYKNRDCDGIAVFDTETRECIFFGIWVDEQAMDITADGLNDVVTWDNNAVHDWDDEEKMTLDDFYDFNDSYNWERIDRKFKIEFKKDEHEDFENWTDDFVYSENQDEALEFAKDWLLEHDHNDFEDLFVQVTNVATGEKDILKIEKPEISMKI